MAQQIKGLKWTHLRNGVQTLGPMMKKRDKEGAPGHGNGERILVKHSACCLLGGPQHNLGRTLAK